MSDDNKDVLRFAAEYAEKQVDLYELLGVDALTPKPDIHRAWRKRSLRYHPDKAGDQFDADNWALFERARDVLADDAARAVYDAAMRARLLRRQERAAMDAQRRRFADDLESRERAARQSYQDTMLRQHEAMQQERARLAELQRLRDDEAARQVVAEQDRDDLAEARRRVRDKREDKARRKLVRDQLRANKALRCASLPKGPANGAVAVPGGFVVDDGGGGGGDGGKKMYWELVCDKLRALQAVRNLEKENDGHGSEAVQQAEMGLAEARQRIYDAEVTFQRQTAAS